MPFCGRNLRCGSLAIVAWINQLEWRQIAIGFLELLSVGTVFAAETMMIEILEMDTYTYHGHSMSDPGSTYRTRDEISSVRQEHDPVERIRKLVLSHDLATEKEMKGEGGNAESKSSPNIIFEELKPASCWTQDFDCHCLLIDLPEFKKEQIRLQADHNSSHVTISGERQEKENKYIRFEQSYKVPENSNVEETSAKFEDEILYVIIPKKTRAPIEGHEITQSSSDDDDDTQNYESYESSRDEDLDKDNDEDNCYNYENDGALEEEFHDTKTENQSNKGKPLEELKKKLKMNRKTIITAVLAFALGVFVSQKLQSNGHTEL
ncbi:SHSP domain-containing protein [Forsythia ovata]|uniref:SHSP domain-containing protein n=1 Tax=Forsythia ovata TaxID=205694 RepID=A0ABD1PGW1_9LAMI